MLYTIQNAIQFLLECIIEYAICNNIWYNIQYMMQNEIWYIIENIISFVTQIRTAQPSHGYVTPTNVWLANLFRNRYRLLTSTTSKHTNHQSRLFQGDILYLKPANNSCLRNKFSDKSCNADLIFFWNRQQSIVAGSTHT